MQYSITDRTVAISGVYQAAALVQQVASTGTASEKYFEACIKSIFYTDVGKPLEVFSGAENIELGLSTLISQLGGDADIIKVQKDMQVTKYSIGVIILEKKLNKNQDLLNKISSGIDIAKNQADHFPITHENIISNLADLYSNTISTLHPKIMVQGEHVYISNPNQANKIRALLLAAVRSAVLWRQCGGTRWQLILQRRKIIDNATLILKSVQN